MSLLFFFHLAAEDPALSDPSLLRKLKANREESLSHLEEVISKFSVKQDDTEEQERRKRQQKAVRGQRRVKILRFNTRCRRFGERGKVYIGKSVLNCFIMMYAR